MESRTGNEKVSIDTLDKLYEKYITMAAGLPNDVTK